MSPKWVPQVGPRESWIVIATARTVQADVGFEQMNNSSEILEYILQNDIPSPIPITYSFLAPNIKGLTNANTILSRHPDSFVPEETPRAADSRKPGLEIAVFAAATETFSQKNLNCDIATSSSASRRSYRVRSRPTYASAPTYPWCSAVPSRDTMWTRTRSRRSPRRSWRWARTRSRWATPPAWARLLGRRSC